MVILPTLAGQVQAAGEVVCQVVGCQYSQQHAALGDVQGLVRQATNDQAHVVLTTTARQSQQGVGTRLVHINEVFQVEHQSLLWQVVFYGFHQFHSTKKQCAVQAMGLHLQTVILQHRVLLRRHHF